MWQNAVNFVWFFVFWNPIHQANGMCMWMIHFWAWLNIGHVGIRKERNIVKWLSDRVSFYLSSYSAFFIYFLIYFRLSSMTKGEIWWWFIFNWDQVLDGRRSSPNSLRHLPFIFVLLSEFFDGISFSFFSFFFCLSFYVRCWHVSTVPPPSKKKEGRMRNSITIFDVFLCTCCVYPQVVGYLPRPAAGTRATVDPLHGVWARGSGSGLVPGTLPITWSRSWTH